MRHTNSFQKAHGSNSSERAWLISLAQVVLLSKGWEQHRGTPQALSDLQVQNDSVSMSSHASASLSLHQYFCVSTWIKTPVAVWKRKHAVISTVWKVFVDTTKPKLALSRQRFLPSCSSFKDQPSCHCSSSSSSLFHFCFLPLSPFSKMFLSFCWLTKGLSNFPQLPCTLVLSLGLPLELSQWPNLFLVQQPAKNSRLSERPVLGKWKCWGYWLHSNCSDCGLYWHKAGPAQKLAGGTEYQRVVDVTNPTLWSCSSQDTNFPNRKTLFMLVPLKYV